MSHAESTGFENRARCTRSLRLGNSALFVPVCERNGTAWCLLTTDVDIFVHPLLESFDLVVGSEQPPARKNMRMEWCRQMRLQISSRTCSWSLPPSPADRSCDSPILAMRPLLESFEVGPSV